MRTDEMERTQTNDRGANALISADKVTGTDVYNRAGDKLGSIDGMMIDKHSGKVRYAIMSFGGFLGIGEKYHQLPWDGLTYSTNAEGYVVNLDREALNGAPSYDRDELNSFDYGNNGRSIDDYYAGQHGFYSTEQQARRNGDQMSSTDDDIDRRQPATGTGSTSSTDPARRDDAVLGSGDSYQSGTSPYGTRR